MYIYSSGRKHTLRKTSCLLNQLVKHLGHVFEDSFHSQKFGTTANQFDAFFNPKNASEANSIDNTPPSTKVLIKLKNVQVLAPPMLLNSELRRRRQPLAFRPVQASL